MVQQRERDIIAAAAAIAAGTQAYAQVISFQNDAGFEWWENSLNLTLSAADQDGDPGAPGAFLQVEGAEICDPHNYYCYDYDWASVVSSQTGDLGATFGIREYYGALEIVMNFPPGIEIGPDLPLLYYDDYYGYCYDPHYGHYPIDCPEWATGAYGAYGADSGACGCMVTDFAPYQDGYMGVSFTLADGLHYGWIKVYRGEDDGDYRLRALAWGYQATPDTPIRAGDTGCPADMDGSGVLDLFDFLRFVNLFNADDPGANCDGVGGLDLFDFLCFTDAFNAGC